MSGRQFSGNTVLGKTLNSMGTEQGSARNKRVTTKRGIIKEVVGRSESSSEYIVIVEINDKGKRFTTKPIKIKGDTLALAVSQGDPEYLIGKWCEASYIGPSADYGEVTIITGPRRNKEEAKLANNVTIKGASFALPGSGML